MSSRVKKCLEPTVLKYIEFLRSVKRAAGIEGQSLRLQIMGYGINKTVKTALIDLAIIDYEADNRWLWLQDEPDRKLALTILNYLLERSKKSRAVIIPGMEETNAILKALAQQFSDYVAKREHSYKTHPIGLKSETLFSEQDTKKELINKAAFAIATGVYSINTDGLTELEIEKQNSGIVFAAKDLVNQLLTK